MAGAKLFCNERGEPSVGQECFTSVDAYGACLRGAGPDGGDGGTQGPVSYDAGAPPKSCSAAADCRGATDGRKHCDSSLGHCVECLSNVDCPLTERCEAGACVSSGTCNNSLECKGGQVCDRVANLCIDCLTDADCRGGVCVTTRCLGRCGSDNDCVAKELLCSATTDGHCVQCQTHSDCAVSEFCAAGFCVPDVCAVGSSHCAGGSVAACGPNGEGDTLRPCGARESCTENNGTASCQPWLCTAGQTECSSLTRLVECAADGLSEVSGKTCATGELCLQGACRTATCAPPDNFCQSGAVTACNADGSAGAIVEQCRNDQHCDATGAKCADDVCAKSQPECNGTRMTVCKSDGSGYATTGTDCAGSNRVCFQGACASGTMDFVGAPGQVYAVPSGKGWNYIDVTTPRTLVEFDVYLKADVPGNVTFVVYESGVSSTYTLIASVSTHIDAGTSYKRSGVLNASLAAGKTYAIGFVSLNPVEVFVGGDWLQAASFGTMSGSDVWDGDSTMPATFDRQTPGMELLREHYLTTP